MLPDRTMFPVRPTRKKGESLPGYVYRLHNANGHRVPSELHSAFIAIYGKADYERKQQATETIKHVVGNFTDADWPLWPWRYLWPRQPYSHVRICPYCLQESGHHRILWELPLVEACPIHECLLIRDCTCPRYINWRFMKPEWKCHCGQPLQDLHAQVAGKGLISTARLVADAIKWAL